MSRLSFMPCIHASLDQIGSTTPYLLPTPYIEAIDNLHDYLCCPIGNKPWYSSFLVIDLLFSGPNGCYTMMLCHSMETRIRCADRLQGLQTVMIVNHILTE